jgi:DNA-binding response OmpR family regulator
MLMGNRQTQTFTQGQQQEDFEGERDVTHLDLERRSVLCVEQQPESLRILADVLVDHHVVAARNAFEALKATHTRGFNGYVIDYWLPDLTGPALCREIRKLDPHAPIVFYTTASGESDRARALNAGATAFLIKPIDPKQLRAKLLALLTSAEVESLHAKLAEELAIQAELERHAAYLRERATAARRLAEQSFERTARIKAYKAFMEARGSRVHFERWWAQVFQSTCANHTDA